MARTLTPPERDYQMIFLAGGITGCPDWQSEVIQALEREEVTLLNPRRQNFPMGDEKAGREQVRWEYEHLRRADAVLFWFAAETVQPIALFELGAWSRPLAATIFVGTHPDYPRRFDVVTQLGLVRPDVKVHSSLYDLINEVRDYLG